MRLPITLLALPTSPLALAAEAQVVQCERLLDGRSGELLGAHTVVVREGRVAGRYGPCGRGPGSSR